MFGLNEGGLSDLAEYTRHWMFDTLKEMQLESYLHHFGNILTLHNTKRKFKNAALLQESFSLFSPPLIKYRPSKSLFYISTFGGDAKIYADWTIRSNVLSLLGIPLHGTTTGTITGFSSSIAVNIEPSGKFVATQCIARFSEFDLRLTGSLAAEILQWFRHVIGRIMQARVEQGYCRIVSERLLPWLKAQFEKFPKSFDLNLTPRLRLTQSLHGISTNENHIDLQMKNRFYANGHVTETLSKLPQDFLVLHGQQTIVSDLKTCKCLDDGEQEPSNIMEVFLDEVTIQEVASTSHYSGELITNITSPFLTTDCELLCLGKIVPRLREVLGPTSLYAEVFTNDPPAVKILDGKAYIYLNLTFSLYENHQTDGLRVALFDDYPAQLEQMDSGPILQIEVVSEAEVFAEMKKRKLEIELKLHNSRAALIQSRISGLNQKTVDLILSMSIPFIENATELFLGNGIEMSELIHIPSRNESMQLERGFLRFQLDANVRNLL
ncbi:hypothetical protein M3Y96_00372100 [Aphelenchoides besseyi]|nr:hypothetical protein M3Y96_00372100 [Aphelenchoides besseyi]